MAPFAASFGEQKYSLAYVLPTINHNQYCVKTKKYFGIYCTRRRHAQWNWHSVVTDEQKVRACK